MSVVCVVSCRVVSYRVAANEWASEQANGRRDLLRQDDELWAAVWDGMI